MADDEGQEAPEAEAADEEQEEDAAEGASEGEGDEGDAEEGVSEGAPFTMDDVFSLFVPSQKTLDKIVAKAEYLQQLKVADSQACQKAMAINELKNLVEGMEKKSPMTEEDSQLLDQKQKELFEMLQEFDEITKNVHQLAVLSELDSKSSFQISPFDKMLGPPMPTSAILNFNQTSTGVQAPVEMEDALEFVPPREKLPRLVICSTGEWPPKIVVCESQKPKGTSTNTDSQEILKLQNEIQKTRSGSQIPVKKIYNKLQVLDKDIMDVEKENAQLTKKLLQLLQGCPEDETERPSSLSEADKGEVSAISEDEMKGDASGDSPESPVEGSVVKEASEFVEKSSLEDQSVELPSGTLPAAPNCTCGKSENAFSLEFELNRIETEVQRMLADIDGADSCCEHRQTKSAVVIGSCNIATLFNPS